jgi:hypothetical protein
MSPLPVGPEHTACAPHLRTATPPGAPGQIQRGLAVDVVDVASPLIRFRRAATLMKLSRHLDQRPGEEKAVCSRRPRLSRGSKEQDGGRQAAEEQAAPAVDPETASPEAPAGGRESAVLETAGTPVTSTSV